MGFFWVANKQKNTKWNVHVFIKETGLALTKIEKGWIRIPSPPWSNSLDDEEFYEELANNELVIFTLLLDYIPIIPFFYLLTTLCYLLN